MRKTLLISILAVAGIAPAFGEVLDMPPEPHGVAVAMVSSLPARGMSMREVARHFGEPAQKHPAAGGDTRKHPPITRWDYAGYSLFFERSTLLDVVVQGAPAAVQGAPAAMYGTEDLQPAFAP